MAYTIVKNALVVHRRLLAAIVHALIVILANYLAFSIRFELNIPSGVLDLYFHNLAYLVLIRFGVYIGLGLHKGLWRYASIRDLVDIIKAITVGSIIFVFLVRYVFGEITYPRSVYVLDWMLMILLTGGARLLVRIFREYMISTSTGLRVLIVGAGDAGEMIVREMKAHPEHNYKPVGFLDDNRYKEGLYIHGVPIFGAISDIEKAVEKLTPDEILIAIPSATRKSLQDIYDILSKFNLPIKTLPGWANILDGSFTVSQIKPLSMEDLLHREPVRSDIYTISNFIQGSRILVTGAGGSIGSELARQIYGYGPSELILVDRYENGLFDIDMELVARGKHKVRSFIRDITDKDAIDKLFEEIMPEMVFHAAAHKHVPLMENNPLEAIKNNVFGTRNLVEASINNGIRHFVMISTDKAVNPTNIMGASKRIAELVTQMANGRSTTNFTTVRFGNVLGSNGSVIQIFRQQLAKGGPITVTHPEIKRYFMLIPEAVQLVLLAASSGGGGEIFVLDMGEPIRILDFAEDFIRLSGMVPYDDIDIRITGLRPGEKLYEELFDSTDDIRPSGNDKYRIAIPKMPTEAEMDASMNELERIVKLQDESAIFDIVRKIIPGFESSR